MINLKKVLVSATALAGFTLASSVVANADSVTVKPGDTVSKIALDHNTTIENIQKLNNLKNVNLIFVGDVLQLDANGNVSQPQVQVPTQNVQVQPSKPVQQSQPTQNVQAAKPVQQVQPTQNVQQPVQQAPQVPAKSYQNTVSGSEQAAKEFIARVESSGSYTAQNGNYYGRYQLSRSYLNGDYSPENQERVADSYVLGRYGSWTNAKAHWDRNNWY